MNRSPSDIAEENKFGAANPGDGRPYGADQAINLALDAVEMDLINDEDFVEAMRAWNEGAWEEFKEIIEGTM